MCRPPLRTRADREALWKALAAGEVQIVSSGHEAHTAEEKLAGARVDFTHIPAGLPSLELLPSLLWTEGVTAGRLAPEQMARVLAEYPAKVLGLYPRKGELKAGADADIVIWDPDWHGEVRAEKLRSAAHWSPWEGKKLQGRARAVFLGGELSAAHGSVLRFGGGHFAERQKVF